MAATLIYPRWPEVDLKTAPLLPPRTRPRTACVGSNEVAFPPPQVCGALPWQAADFAAAATLAELQGLAGPLLGSPCLC